MGDEGRLVGEGNERVLGQVPNPVDPAVALDVPHLLVELCRAPMTLPGKDEGEVSRPGCTRRGHGANEPQDILAGLQIADRQNESFR